MSRKLSTPQQVNIKGHNKGMKFAEISMSKKLFGWANSVKKSDKLVTDAVVLDENDQNVGDSSDRTQSNVLSSSPLSPEMGFARCFDNRNITSVMRTNDLLVDTPNNALSLNNTQQNVYQFSDIIGLHIGTNVQINNNVEQSSDRRSNSSDVIQKTRSNSGDVIQKTRSIDGEW